MNERIEKLAEECGFRSNPDLYDRNQSFDIPKFYELVVKECANHILKSSDRYRKEYFADKVLELL